MKYIFKKGGKILNKVSDKGKEPKKREDLECFRIEIESNDYIQKDSVGEKEIKEVGKF